jgi:environmental stress-induced protein Ves
MRIIKFTDLQQTPWKNGGGITREIAAGRTGEEMAWRLSIADVGVDGPFSKFDGLHRILTVIEGQGMELISPFEILQADYAVPVNFDGALEIQSRLKDGPLRDLNVIYNPALCTGHAQVIKGYSRHFIEAKPGQVHALHCMRGSVALGEMEQLQQGDTALIDCDTIQFAVAEGASALLITIVLST